MKYTDYDNLRNTMMKIFNEAFASWRENIDRYMLSSGPSIVSIKVMPPSLRVSHDTVFEKPTDLPGGHMPSYLTFYTHDQEKEELK